MHLLKVAGGVHQALIQALPVDCQVVNLTATLTVCPNPSFLPCKETGSIAPLPKPISSLREVGVLIPPTVGDIWSIELPCPQHPRGPPDDDREVFRCSLARKIIKGEG